MVRGGKQQPPSTPKKTSKAPGPPGTPSGEVPPDTGPAPPNSLEACIAAGDIYTVELGGAKGGVVGVGEKGGMSAAEIEEEAKRVRDTPAPTHAKPCVRPTTEQYPHVVDPNWLGDGPGPDHYKSESETSKELREQAWTVGVLLIYLRTQFWLVMKRGFRPMCCLCIGVLFFISMKPLVRAVFQAAFGTLALANGIPILVNRPLFEELADETVRRMQKHGLQPSTLISVTSGGNTTGVFTGYSEEGADTSSRDSDGVASSIYAYVRSLTGRGLSFMGYADATAYYVRDGDSSNRERYDALLEKTGAEPKFVASSVHASKVAIALLEIGAAGNDGRISILMPVRCSVLDRWIRFRCVVSRGLVDTPVQPSDELCADALAAAQKMAHAPGGLQRLYRETGLVYKTSHPEKSGKAIIVGEYPGRDAAKGKKLRAQLRKGLKGAREMTASVEKVLGEVAAASGGVSIETIHEATKEAGFPSVAPNSAFGPGFRIAFDQFLGAVGKKLNKVGCMGSTKTTKGKRAVDESGSGLGTGGKGSKKPRSKKKKKSPYPRGPGQPGQAENALFR